VGGVAVWAHVGGFVAGLLMVKLFGERARRYPYAWR
jgi:membrane associated rhomboid family serine protease